MIDYSSEFSEYHIEESVERFGYYLNTIIPPESSSDDLDLNDEDYVQSDFVHRQNE